MISGHFAYFLLFALPYFRTVISTKIWNMKITFRLNMRHSNCEV